MALNLILTENQRRFLQEQVSLWTGLSLDANLSLIQKSLILGLTEDRSAAADNRGNQDFQHNPLFWSGQILEPVINQWLVQELEKKKVTHAPIWPQGKKFAVCLTHDVDGVSAHSLSGPARHLKTSLQALNKGDGGIKGLLQCSAFFAWAAANASVRKTMQVFDPWLELEEKLGFRSTFFFFPDKAGRYHLHDGPYYRHHDRLYFDGAWISVPEFMRELARRGWEVGLHGTFLSFDDAPELQRQKAQLERSLGSEVVSIRQHCLHFDISKTPRAQSLAGFKFDSTYGFNRIIGFRNGLAFPFYHYDLQADKPLPIIQIPLHIQDGALLRKDNLDLTPDLALKHACEMIDKVEQTNGLITLLWHPRPVNAKYAGWFWVYRELLEYLAGKDVWVATVRDIGNWWEQRGQNCRSAQCADSYDRLPMGQQG